jgi:hypothetical protein
LYQVHSRVLEGKVVKTNIEKDQKALGILSPEEREMSNFPKPTFDWFFWAE